MADGSAFLEALEHEMRGALEDSWFTLLRWVHGTHYGDTLRSARAALQDERLLPSARVLAAMAKHFEGSYVGFIRAQSERARRALLEQPWSDEAASRFRRFSEKSIEDQKILEASDRSTFEDYRRQYLSLQ